MKIKFIFSILIIGMLISACSNEDWDFPDYTNNAVYFPFQTPVRTLILGKYDQGINENDNNKRFEMGVTMSGVYENTEDRRVHFEVDNSLLNGVANVQVLPQEYFNIQTESPVTIPAGSTKGRITVQLTDAFFADELSFAPEGMVNYVIPVKITQAENLDSILTGFSVRENPNKLVAEDWDVLPKDYTLFGVKYINKYHGNYLRRGEDVMTDVDGNTEINTYREDYVVDDEIVMVSTSGENSVVLQNRVRRGEDESPGDVILELLFDGSDNCTITSAEDDPYNVTGSGQFVADGDEWGTKARDVIYLDYTYTDALNNETHAVKDTLVIRDRAVSFETFTPEML